MRETVEYGEELIEFELLFVNRKSLGIVVTPERLVIVKVPLDTSLDKIKQVVRKRAVWIQKQIQFFKSFHPLTPQRKFIGGETHLYLGRQYRLKLFQSNLLQVKLKSGYLEIYTPDKNNKEKIEEQLDLWYKAHAIVKFHDYMNQLIKRHPGHEFKVSELVLRTMDKRWGSCTSDGKIILNTILVKAPKACIEYVLVHELCHLKYPHHNKAFYELQTLLMPDWEIWKSRLEHFLS